MTPFTWTTEIEIYLPWRINKNKKNCVYNTGTLQPICSWFCVPHFYFHKLIIISDLQNYFHEFSIFSGHRSIWQTRIIILLCVSPSTSITKQKTNQRAVSYIIASRAINKKKKKFKKQKRKFFLRNIYFLLLSF